MYFYGLILEREEEGKRSVDRKGGERERGTERERERERERRETSICYSIYAFIG